MTNTIVQDGNDPPKVRILDVELACLSAQEAVQRIERLIQEGGSHLVFFANAHTLCLAWEDPAYRSVLNSASLVLNDGTGISWAARRQGVRFQENLVGTDFIPFLCQNVQDRGYRFFLLGARPGVAQAAAQALQERFPLLSIAGTYHGYFSTEENENVLARIREARTDVLLVGMGNPLQERWLHEHLASTGTAVGIGVGALFDYLSGRLKRAPRWMLDRGLEWVWRLAMEPRRLWRRYLIGNWKFIWYVLHDHPKG